MNFLKNIEVETIYLVGDIIDISQLKRGFHWDSGINAVLRRVFKLVKNGVRVVYIPGNHDREAGDFAGMDFAGIEFKTRCVHQTLAGKRLLVTHGHEFDGILNEKWMFLYTLGDRFYDIAIVLSKILNRMLRIFGIEWSLSHYLKTKVKNVIAFINNFERLLVHEAKKHAVDGVIAGHIHTPDLKMVDDLIYANCGCWTELVSAVAEDTDGEIVIISGNGEDNMKAMNMDEWNNPDFSDDGSGKGKTKKGFKAKAHDLVFRHIHGGKLIYNTCWEDPRIDRQLLELDSDSEVVMITSAGCNALDYLLDNPERIHSIDLNPKQNALLELKMALFERGDYDDLFQMFGAGYHPKIKNLYAELRPSLTKAAAKFWDRKIYYFDKPKIRKSFYYHGASGNVAWLFRQFLKSHKNLRTLVLELFESKTLEEQERLYKSIEPKFWNKFTTWLVKNPFTMAMVGVPRAQIKLIADRHDDGLADYVREKMANLLTKAPVHDNYFWRVYLTGSYTPSCCPNYLKEGNFETIRERLNRLNIHTGGVSGFLEDNPGAYSHFILLDHQDWLAANDPEELRREWELIFANAGTNAKILMRSAGENIDFIPEDIRQRIEFNNELTERLSRLDRVGTYANTSLGTIK